MHGRIRFNRTNGPGSNASASGGHTLKLWRRKTGEGFDLYVPGFDQVDFVRGNTIVIRDSETGLLRRDVYLGSGSASVSGHLALTYGYPPAGSRARWLTAGRLQSCDG